MATFKEITELTQATEVSGAEKLPISSTQYLSINQIIEAAMSAATTDLDTYLEKSEVSGGTIGQALVKSSDNDYEFTWGSLTTTLGSLSNVAQAADETDLQTDYVLVKLKGETSWTKKNITELGSGDNPADNYRLYITAVTSPVKVVQIGTPCNLQFTFTSQYRVSSDSEWVDTNELGSAVVYVATEGESPEYIVPTNGIKQVSSGGTTQTIDVSEFLSSPSSLVKIEVRGLSSQISCALPLIWTVRRTNLQLSISAFQWWVTKIPNNTNIVPVYIQGNNIYKYLEISITGPGNYSYSETQAIGYAQYIEAPYQQVILPTLENFTEGVYTISLQLRDADSVLYTDLVSVDYIYVNQNSSNKFVVIHNVDSSLENWYDRNVPFEYSIYDGSNNVSSILFDVSKDDTVIISDFYENVDTNTKESYILSLEVETISTEDFNLDIDIYDDSDRLSSYGNYTFTTANSRGFVVQQGYSFYMDSKKRNNGETNKNYIRNQVNNNLISATWTRMNWVTDGWILDEELNRRSLKLLAGTSCVINYRPFENEVTSSGKTIELVYKVSNPTNLSVPVFTIAKDDELLNKFTGLKIYPNKITLFSDKTYVEANQSLNTKEDEIIHLTIVIFPNIKYSNLDLVIFYINGRRNKEFEYNVNNDDRFVLGNYGNIIIGSTSADIDVYGLRIYESAISDDAVLLNYIASLQTTLEKTTERDKNDVLDDLSSTLVDFRKVKDLCNTLVYTPYDNGSGVYYHLPKYGDGKKNYQYGDIDICFKDRPTDSVRLSNVRLEGQGTSSMGYYRWNFKFQLLGGNESGLPANVGATTLMKLEPYVAPETTKTWVMNSSIPKANKFTAKKNYASSMQSHKIGSVNSVTDLWKLLGLTNPGVEDLSTARVSVYQDPFVVFTKETVNGVDTYTFCGEYTMGPDKGDKYCFNYDTTKFPNLISLEGCDNIPYPCMFRVPLTTSNFILNDDIFYYYGTKCWEVDAGNAARVDLWLSAYNLAYQCSPEIEPFNGTLEELNALTYTVVDGVTTILSNEYTSGNKEYWISKEGDPNQYNLYYWSYATAVKSFIPSDIGDGTINLVTQLVDNGYGLTQADIDGAADDDAINTLFVNARVEKFRLEASTYWDIDDAIFHRNWVEVNAATDQRAKNTYPYTYGQYTKLVDGVETTFNSKWKWRFDDMDTIFDTDNTGQPSKEYFIEVRDTRNGGNVWNGERSVFWNLMELAFKDQIISKMRLFLNGMVVLGEGSGSPLENLLAFYYKYYINATQKYFPARIINKDADYSYDSAKVAWYTNYLNYNYSIDPLLQSLGDHLLAELRWLEYRMVFIMSKYQFGMFSTGAAGRIGGRLSGNSVSFTLTPAITMYPIIQTGSTIIGGYSTSTPSERVMAGIPYTMDLTLGGGGDQEVYVMGADYMQDIGDWYDKNYYGSFSVSGKMLQRLSLGNTDNNATITIQINQLNINGCTALQYLNLANISTLQGSLNLSDAIHLTTLLINGTNLLSVTLPQGSALAEITYPSSIRELKLDSLPLLTTPNVDISLCSEYLTNMYVANCPLLSPISMLLDIMASQTNQENHNLYGIRITDFDEIVTGYDLNDLLALTDGTYRELNTSAQVTINPPYLKGTLRVNTGVYQSDINTLTTYFPNLTVVTAGLYWIEFASSDFKDFIVNLYDTNDDDGLDTAEANLITSLTIGNPSDTTAVLSSIVSFTDLSLLPELETVSINNMVNITSLTLPSSITTISTKNLPSLVGTLDLSSYTNLTSIDLSGTAITNVELPDSALTYIKYPSTEQSVILVDYTSLTTSNVVTSLCTNSIVNLGISGCTSINAIDMLLAILASQGNSLQRVRIDGISKSLTSDAVAYFNSLKVLANGNYHGLDENMEIPGTAINAYLQGTITVENTTGVYEEDYNIIHNYFGDSLTLTVTNFYIPIQNTELLTALKTQYNITQEGILPSEASSRTTMTLGDASNSTEVLSTVTSFTELATYFTSLTTLSISNVVNLQTLTLPTSLTEINFKNLTSYTSNGVLDLSTLSSLQEINIKGTSNVESILLPTTSVLDTITYPSSTRRLLLDNQPYLTNANVNITACINSIEDYRISDCISIADPFIKLSTILSSANNSLQRVRITGFNLTYADASILTTLNTLTSYSGDTPIYGGLDANNNATSKAVLIGSITIQSGAYQSDVDSLVEYFGASNLIITVAGGFHLSFADPAVLSILLSSSVNTIVSADYSSGSNVQRIVPEGSDHCTSAQLASLVSLSYNENNSQSMFTSWNSTSAGYNITTFNEFVNFTGLRYLNKAAFVGCVNLTEITLPPNLLIIGNQAFHNCKALVNLVIPEGVTTIESFGQSLNALDYLELPSTITTLASVSSLLPNQYDTGHRYTLVCKAVVPPTLGNGFGYHGDPKTIYVPDDSVNAYKSASMWSNYSSRIYALSTRP